MRRADIVVSNVAFHRNGVSGNGFHVVYFRQARDDERMVGIVFPEMGNVAVISQDNTAEKWRGDEFEPALREAVEAYETSRSWAKVK